MQNDKKYMNGKMMKKTIIDQLKTIKPPENASIEQSIEVLVQQAELYTKFLLSKHDVIKTTTISENKKRGKWKEQQSQLKCIVEQQQQQQQNQLFTRLNQQPSTLKGGQLKFYQLVGLNWMISLYQSGISGILADDMGLGKTIQAISIICFIRQFKKIKGPHIIIAPKITLGNWIAQFKKWLPQCNVLKLIATKDERQEILSTKVQKGKFDVLVTSFEGVRLSLNTLRRIKWHYIVIDEAHKIKNEGSQLSQVVRKLSTQCKLLLTGTPLQNNLHQIWSLLNFLLPEIFDSSELFDNWFESQKKQSINQQDIEKWNLKMISKLHKILKPFMLRRTKIQVEKNLPKKQQLHIYVGLTDTQLKLYKNLLQNRNISQIDKKYYLNLVMQLRKVCNHPYLFPNIEPQNSPSLGQHLVQSSGKMLVLDRLLKKLYLDNSHQVLIFSQMTMVLDILEDYCNLRLYQYCRIDGSTDMNSRDQQIEQFMNPNSTKFIFLLSTRAGGLGINLTSADTVVIYDSDWNPQIDLQAMDRVHRIGQKKMVKVYRLVTQKTVQQKIIRRQAIKLNLDHLVIQQAKKQSKNNSLTRDEIKEILQYGVSSIFNANKGTITDQQIDVILARGQTKTNQLNQQVAQKLKDVENNSTIDFSMNSINIFDFMGQDEQKKKKDAQALDEIYIKQLQCSNDLRSRRQKGKQINYIIDVNKSLKKQNQKNQKKYILPDYHFYQNKDILLELLQKQQDYNSNKNGQLFQQQLTQQQQQLKQNLLNSGFKNWTKQDFNNFILSNQKYGRKNIKNISQYVNKSEQEIQKYSKIFWQRIDELIQNEKIIKQIQLGQDRIEIRKQNQQLLEWKMYRCYKIDFNQQDYTKFRSKLYSYYADKYLTQMIYDYGLCNINLVKENIRNQSMFRFDHFFRSRTQSQLNKRLMSIFKLLEKEKDNQELGLNTQTIKQAKKRQKKLKKQAKQNDLKKQNNNNNNINNNNNNSNNNNNNIKEQEQQEQQHESLDIKDVVKQTLLSHYQTNNNDCAEISSSSADDQVIIQQ